MLSEGKEEVAVFWNGRRVYHGISVSVSSILWVSNDFHELQCLTERRTDFNVSLLTFYCEKQSVWVVFQHNFRCWFFTWQVCKSSFFIRIWNCVRFYLKPYAEIKLQIEYSYLIVNVSYVIERYYVLAILFLPRYMYNS